MLVAESHRTRRLVGRLDRGADLLPTLTELCRVHQVRSGELRAVGALEQVVICEHDQEQRGARPARRFDARFEVLSLMGSISELDGRLHLQAHLTMSRERDNGVEVLGGRLVSAKVFALEFVLEAYDDLLVRRSADAGTGLTLLSDAISLAPVATAAGTGAVSSPHSMPMPATAMAVTAVSPTPPPAAATVAPVPANAPPSPATAPPRAAPAAASAPAHAAPIAAAPPPAPAWKEVMQASRAAEELPARSWPEEIQAAPGDYIDHPKFGRCQVERVEGEYEFVSARLRNQRLIRLSLDVITLELVGKEGTHRLFRAVPGRT